MFKLGCSRKNTLTALVKWVVPNEPLLLKRILPRKSPCCADNSCSNSILNANIFWQTITACSPASVNCTCRVVRWNKRALSHSSIRAIWRVIMGLDISKRSAVAVKLPVSATDKNTLMAVNLSMYAPNYFK